MSFGNFRPSGRIIIGFRFWGEMLIPIIREENILENCCSLTLSSLWILESSPKKIIALLSPNNIVSILLPYVAQYLRHTRLWSLSERGRVNSMPLGRDNTEWDIWEGCSPSCQLAGPPVGWSTTAVKRLPQGCTVGEISIRTGTEVSQTGQPCLHVFEGLLQSLPLNILVGLWGKTPRTSH